MPYSQELGSAPPAHPWMIANEDVAQSPVLNRYWYMEPFFGVAVQICSIRCETGSVGVTSQSEGGSSRQKAG